jgi:hypothetical protein
MFWSNLELIAFSCIGSRSAASRMSSLEWRIADADATLARAQGWACRAEFKGPMSRRQITEWRKFSLLPQPRADAHSDVHQKRDISLDFNTKAECCRPSAVVSGAMTEPSGCRNRKSAGNPARTQTGQTADPPRAEFIDSNGLFARLVFHRVRPRSRSSVDAGLRSCASAECAAHDPGSGSVMVAAPDVGSPLALRAGRRVTLVRADSPELEPAPIETLFTELASRRLRSLAPRERP